MAGSAPVTRPELWIETLSRLSGADRIADGYLDRPELGPYLFVFVLGVGYLYGVSLLGYLVTGTIRFVADPATNLIVPALLVITYSLCRLDEQAATVIGELPSRDEEVERVRSDDSIDSGRSGFYDAVDRFVSRTGLAPDLETVDPVRLVPTPLKVGVFLVALAYHGAWLLSKPPSYYALIDLIGPYSAVGFFLIQPFAYLLLAELVSLVIGIHVLLPFAISIDRRIDFTDIHDFGGLRPIGRLLKTSAVYLLVLLSVYVVFLAFAIGPDIGDVRHLSILLGSSGVILLLFLAPVFWLHMHMRRMRAAKLEAIGGAFAAAGEDDRLPPAVPAPDEDVTEYTRAYLKLVRVRDTKAYPLDIGIVEELLLVLAIPFLIQIAATAVLGYL